MPQLVNNIEYYKLSEMAEIAGVNARTLRRWIANGYLDDFLYRYRKEKKSTLLFRLEPPADDDILWDGETNIYHLPERSS